MPGYAHASWFEPPPPFATCTMLPPPSPPSSFNAAYTDASTPKPISPCVKPDSKFAIAPWIHAWRCGPPLLSSTSE